MVSATDLSGSPHHLDTVGSLKIWSRRPSSPGCTCRRITRRPRSSGGEVDPDRAQSLVERIDRELHDLAFGVTVVGDETRVGRVERAGDEWEALDEALLDPGGL